jgi:hypothetical protein
MAEGLVIELRGESVGKPAPFGLVRSFFVASMICWLVAAEALVNGAPELSHDDLGSPAVLLAMHLFTVGFLAFAVAGAALHVLPTLLRSSVNPRFGYAGLAGLGGGPLLAVGIARHLPDLTWVSSACVAAGACCVLVGVGRLLLHAPRNRLLLASRLGVTASGLNALLAFVAGLLLFARGWRGFAGISEESLIAIHLHLAVVGWLTLLLVSVGRTLLPMLTLAPRAPARSRPVDEMLVVAGLWIGVAGFALGERALTTTGYLVVLVGLGRFARVLAAAWRARPRVLECLFVHVLAGFVFLAEAALLAGIALFDGSLQVRSAYVCLLLLGFVGGITVAHVGKLLALSAWVWWPAGPRPKQSALYPKRLWLAESGLFAFGVEILAFSLLLANTTLARVGAGLLALSAACAVTAVSRTLNLRAVREGT